LISATFHQRIAEARFDTDPVAFCVSQPILTRLVTTFLEIDALNSRYREAEAALLEQPT
jgi:hypothetical protein